MCKEIDSAVYVKSSRVATVKLMIEQRQACLAVGTSLPFSLECLVELLRSRNQHLGQQLDHSVYCVPVQPCLANCVVSTVRDLTQARSSLDSRDSPVAG